MWMKMDENRLHICFSESVVNNGLVNFFSPQKKKSCSFAFFFRTQEVLYHPLTYKEPMGGCGIHPFCHEPSPKSPQRGGLPPIL
jgi:hypothetical protein